MNDSLSIQSSLHPEQEPNPRLALPAPHDPASRWTWLSAKVHRPARICLLSLMLGAVLLAGPGCAPQQSGADQVPDLNHALTALKDAPLAGMPASVDAVVEAYLAQSGAPPGVAVGILQNNSISYLKGYGWADLAGNIPFTHETASVVGSVSKTWTAMAVLRLMEMGYLDLDDSVAQYVPVPAAWAGFTLRHLLSHTSGLQRDPTFLATLNTEAELSQFLFPQFPFPIPHLGIHPRLVLYSFQQTPVVGFDPGATAEYSNTGYMLLGAVIDAISGTNKDAFGDAHSGYESFVWRQVGYFDGGLNGTQMISPALNEYWRQADIPSLARGYQFNGADYDLVTAANSPTLQSGPAGWEGPAGGWTMTIGDLARLMAAIQNDAIISAETKAEMMQPHGVTVDGQGQVTAIWGLGVAMAEKLGRPAYMHDGAYPGYRARYTVWPEEQFGVAVIANESNADMRNITDQIASIFMEAENGSRADSPAAAGFPQARKEKNLSAMLKGAHRETSEGVDDNDAGLGANSLTVGPLPTLTRDQRRSLLTGLLQTERSQQQSQQFRRIIQHRLEKSGCWNLLEDLTKEMGISIVEALAPCVDAATPSSGHSHCLKTMLDRLEREGAITPRQRIQLERCLSSF